MNLPGAESNGSAILLRGINKRFGDHQAVKNLDLSIPKGSVYGLLGPNGAGKTTTLRMILRILAPDSGEIFIHGAPIEKVGTDIFGYLPEDRGLYTRMKVRDVLIYLAELKGVPRSVSSSKIQHWLDRFELTEWTNARVHQLSKGMQQKLQLIVAIIHDPEIIVLDEPFSGLDPINQGVFKEIIQEFHQQNKTILFSTHMIEHAERLCDSVCILARGESVVDGTVADVRRDHGGRYLALAFDKWRQEDINELQRLPHVREVRVHGNHGEVSINESADISALLEYFVKKKLPLRRFEVVDPSLEQIFIEKVGIDPAELAADESGGESV